MRVHHLNCGTQCLLGGCLISGQGSLFRRAPLVCHCLLIESEAGLILVDTGLGVQDVQKPQHRLTPQFRFLAQPQLRLQETALYQLEQLGFSRHEVRHIILTHLDFDHAGGLSDFPQARVHVLEAEYQSAVTALSSQNPVQPWGQFRHRYRYRPAQWVHQPQWVRYSTQGETWFGFDCVQQLQGLPPEILLIPLVGHTQGHTGVAVQTPEGWLLHAGDAYYFHGEIHPTRPTCPLGLSLVQWIGDMNHQARRENQTRLRQLNDRPGSPIQIISAHDPIEFERCLAHPRVSP